MRNLHLRPGSEPEAEWPVRGKASGVGASEIERAARELVAAYGPRAIDLMQKRTRAVRRSGDAESATLWRAIAEAVEEHLATRAASSGPSGLAD